MRVLSVEYTPLLRKFVTFIHPFSLSHIVSLVKMMAPLVWIQSLMISPINVAVKN